MSNKIKIEIKLKTIKCVKLINIDKQDEQLKFR